MEGKFIFFLLFCCLSGSSLGCVCSDKPDGYLCSASCSTFIRCIGGISVSTQCNQGDVVHIDIMRCVHPDFAPSPCGTGAEKNCSGMTDGIYADVEMGCFSFYSCAGGAFDWRQFCADGLVFDETAGVCSWVDQICPPCGTGIQRDEPCEISDPCDCANRPNGDVCLSDCQMHVTCMDQVAVTQSCNDTALVIDYDTGTCKLESEVAPPCGTLDVCDCTQGVDRVCAQPACDTKIECASGERSESTCLPTDQVYNSNYVCDQVSNVCLPCGTNTAVDCT